MDGEHIRDRLLAYRASRGWSQARTAEESGVSNATVAHIESGYSPNPRRITLMKLAQGFEVSLDEFLSDNPPKAPGPSLPGSLLRSRAGHDFLTRSLTETIAFGTSASQDEIRARIRDLSEESRVLHEAIQKLPEYLPELFGPSPSGKTLPHAKDPEALKRAKEELQEVAKGFVVRVMALAEIGGGKDLIAEAEHIVAEHQEANVPS